MASNYKKEAKSIQLRFKAVIGLENWNWTKPNENESVPKFN